MKTTMITAHTGADSTPDNSLAFVHHVIFTRADAMEVDVRNEPENGSLVITHEKPVKKAPKLEEVFQLLSSYHGIRLNTDLKVPGIEERVYRLAQKYGMENRLIYSGSVHDAFISENEFTRHAEAYLNLEEHVKNLYLNYREIPDFELTAADEITKACEMYHAHVVNVYEGILTRRFIEILKARNIGVSAWTVNEPRKIDYFLSKEIYNLTTRNLAYALKAKEKMEIQADENIPGGNE